VIGFGDIGRRAARMGRALGMHAQRARRRRCRRARRRGATTRSSRAPSIALLAEADVVTLHVPLVAATRHLIRRSPARGR
jgi:(S)-sulfolactate dehydrogenase